MIGAVQCDMVTVGANKGGKAEFVTLRVSLLDPDPTTPPPAGYVPLGHAYTLWFASDHRGMVEYYRTQGGVPASASVYDAELSIRMPREDDSGPVKVDAPAAPSPFKLTATVGRLEDVRVNAAVDFWAKVPAGTMVQRPDTLDLLRLGLEVTDGAVTPSPGSELARIFCGDGVRRTSQGAVGFDAGSVRLFFPDGRFAVGVQDRQLSATTSSASCPRPKEIASSRSSSAPAP